MTNDTMIRPPIKLRSEKQEEELQERVQEYKEQEGLLKARAWGELLKIGIKNVDSLEDIEE